VDAGKEVSPQLVIATGDSPKLFDFVEEALNQVAFPVECKVAMPRMLAIRLGRDDRGDVGRL
jgi:hypothetical protein